MFNQKRQLIATVALLLLAIASSYGYLKTSRELRLARAQVQAIALNDKVLIFTENFVEKILKAKGDVDFDTRLKIENDVRELNDKDILAQWQKFTASKVDTEAQAEVKNLLSLLVSKLSVR